MRRVKFRSDVLPRTLLLACSAWVALGGLAAAQMSLDERPAAPGEWGYRPADGAVSATNPPSFAWRPQKDVVTWELVLARADQREAIVHRETDIVFNVYCPGRTFPPGEYVWSYRGRAKDGSATSWSTARAFTIGPDAVAMPLPPREELLARIPERHPRLFVRPEQMPGLRALAEGDLGSQYEGLLKKCDALLKDPPPTEEPPKYPPDVVTKSDEWAAIWWGNRVYTINALENAATLAFTWQLSGKREYGELAKRILLDCVEWDPKGASGYRYNDEAGMPFAYHFCRTYTFIYDLLTEEERQACRDMMRIRGKEMYDHLYPRHLWQPYSSHSNRAWHFLGEIGVTFRGEIEEADDWTWFAMNVFQNVYPVWSDDQGGWHEGVGYWSSYIDRFTWWADIMRAAFGINAFDKPYFSKIGDYPMYLMPPHSQDGGFGDLVENRKATSNVPLVSVLAAQAGNPHWMWYVEQMNGPTAKSGYVGYIRGAQPSVASLPPTDLPTSKLFEGTGQAYLNTTLLDGRENVQILFKSSPFGTQSHGYEANNSFLLNAFGERLLIRTGRRDIYGSDHHSKWMWSTRSVNNITVDGLGQVSHSASSQGRIIAFETSPAVDIVVGEAGEAYRTQKSEVYPDGRVLERFTRAIVFVKPDLVIVFDRLEATTPSTFEYWLHAVNPFEVGEDQKIGLTVNDVVCPIEFLEPKGLVFAQTDQYDPNPRPKVTVREWHLTATTPEKATEQAFVVALQPRRAAEAGTCVDVRCEAVEGGYAVSASLPDGRRLKMRLPTDDRPLEVELLDGGGTRSQTLQVDLRDAGR